MPDRFASHSSSLDSPAAHAFAVSPDDALALTEATRALYVGSGGNLAVTMTSGAEVSFANVPPGAMLPLRVSHVKATGTTASQIIALV